MPYSLYQIQAFVALLLLMGFALAQAFRLERVQRGWILPALAALLFAGWSLHAVVLEGWLGFWNEHIRNAWGNQIWFDLLLAFGCAWALIVPRLRAVGMRPLPWLLLLFCTGSIGLLLMFARCLFLESRSLSRQN